MSDGIDTTGHRKPRLMRNASVLASVTAVALLLLLFFRPRTEDSQFPLLSISQPIQEFGTFQIPDSDSQLKIEELGNGEIDLTVSERNLTLLALVGIESDTRDTHSVAVNKGFRWFAAVDEYQNLWVCSAAQDASNPYVLVQGVRFMPPNDQLISCVESVTDTGNWVGVPSAFLAQIHMHYPSTTIPKMSQQYTADQSQQLRRRL